MGFRSVQMPVFEDEDEDENEDEQAESVRSNSRSLNRSAANPSGQFRMPPRRIPAGFLLCFNRDFPRLLSGSRSHEPTAAQLVFL